MVSAGKQLKKPKSQKASEEEHVKYDEELAKHKKTDASKYYMKKRLEKQKNNTSFQKYQELKKMVSAGKQLKKLKSLKSSEEEHVKYDEELAKHKKTDASKYYMKKRLEKQKNNTSFQKYQELKKMVSAGKQLKKVQELNNENTSGENSHAVLDIPIFTEEFLNFNKARETDLRNLCKNVKNEEQKICIIEKHNETIQNAITNIKANTKKLDAGYSKYKQHLNRLRSQLLEKLAYIESKSDAVPFSNETIDKYMVDLSKQLTNDNVSKDVWMIKCIKKAFPNMDSS